MSTLTDQEYQQVVQALGRKPNEVELGIFSVMWSEHCCYKSSKIYLKQFPTKSSRVLQGPGENAGIIDIGDGYAIAFKMESHNHPSFIEPYQGAATGVGGILRDIFTMGARPIASLNSLRFGAMNHPRTPYLLRGVVAGIGGYGNCMWIPTVGGETTFDECYNGNIFVNAFTLGVLKKDKIFRGIAKGVGNPVILVGSKTGRDGIHGATMASDVFDKESESKRPTVQVGDPFTEKKLMEACLEAFELEGAIVGIQDMGAAGFTCSSFEMSAKGGVGMELMLDKIPLRETGMTPYEIMLSESQERMLLIAQKGREEDLRKIFEKWELEFAIVGEVIAEKRVKGYFHGELAFDLPVEPVTDAAPVYERPVEVPGTRFQVPSTSNLESRTSDNYNDILLKLLSSPNLCSKEWVWRQYDKTVGTNTLLASGADAAVVRIKENGKAIAMSVDGKAKDCYLNPYLGAVETVAEAARNLVCVGAKPVGVSDCLNFGNPENPEIMWEFKEVCRGLTDACKKFETPIVGGNVSFYNETEGKNIYPTPIVAMVGLLEKGVTPMTPWWKQNGDIIYLIGENNDQPFDFEQELAVQGLCLEAFQKGLLQSAHDVSEGGLAVTLAECCFGKNSLGATVDVNDGLAPEAILFGEAPSRIVVSLKPENEKEFVALVKNGVTSPTLIGKVGGNKLKINDWVDESIDKLWKGWVRGWG